jgi:hypothetical protein
MNSFQFLAFSSFVWKLVFKIVKSISDEENVTQHPSLTKFNFISADKYTIKKANSPFGYK